MFDTFKTQKELASVFAPSGNEGELINRITEMAKPFADECRSDALGSLIIRKKGAGGGRRVMLSAHTDSIGLVVTHIDEKGFLRFCSVGGFRPPRIIGSTVVFARGAKGVVAAEEKCKIEDIKPHDCYVDIGADSREAALKHVNIGDMAVFSADTYISGNRIISPYLDDRIGVVILLQVLSMASNPVNDIYFVFSAQEEVGLRGAKTAAYGIEPEVAIAVDVSGAGDMPGVKTPLNCALGGGAAIKIRDNSLLAHGGVVKWLENTANEGKIKYQRDVAAAGGTDAGAIHVSRAGVPSGVVSIPARYVHTNAEMADLSDIEACTRLILAAINSKVDFL